MGITEHGESTQRATIRQHGSSEDNGVCGNEAISSDPDRLAPLLRATQLDAVGQNQRSKPQDAATGTDADGICAVQIVTVRDDRMFRKQEFGHSARGSGKKWIVLSTAWRARKPIQIADPATRV